ncbi:DUF3016 domain-containing protein [Thalassomonas actiniarum]|uniref:DUF3016 domain-containing protein n=1 Tax=Thalassomonas actiniarum TaxID=485447 RepID=A0AAF0C296_9GAMM|nr:DUF3016 domain-containing protein [Thalassomonas actiniarum]WDD98242.1 DUF3016 domain-containing protein [Thalassomonas actiniarum]
MKKHIGLIITTGALLLMTSTALSTAFAAGSEVKWTEPEKYRDIRPGDENRKRFQERTFKELESYFAKLAARLPEKQQLKIEVTDVDLAGDVRFGSHRQIRIIKEIYAPRMTFSYQLLAADETVLSSGEVNLKDMSFMRGSRLKHRTESLNYEKNMLDDWFEETFSPVVAAVKQGE